MESCLSDSMEDLDPLFLEMRLRKRFLLLEGVVGAAGTDVCEPEPELKSDGRAGNGPCESIDHRESGVMSQSSARSVYGFDSKSSSSSKAD